MLAVLQRLGVACVSSFENRLQACWLQKLQVRKIAERKIVRRIKAFKLAMFSSKINYDFERSNIRNCCDVYRTLAQYSESVAKTMIKACVEWEN